MQQRVRSIGIAAVVLGSITAGVGGLSLVDNPFGWAGLLEGPRAAMVLVGTSVVVVGAGAWALARPHGGNRLVVISACGVVAGTVTFLVGAPLTGTNACRDGAVSVCESSTENMFGRSLGMGLAIALALLIFVLTSLLLWKVSAAVRHDAN